MSEIVEVVLSLMGLGETELEAKPLIVPTG
jgi:hypothetical protein